MKDVKDFKLPAGSPWSAGIGAGLGAFFLGALPYLFAEMKEKGMTQLEKAFNSLLILLCQQLAEKDEQVVKLQKDLAERPTREQLNASEQRALRLGDEMASLRREIDELGKQNKTLLAQTPQASRRRRPEAARST